MRARHAQPITRERPGELLAARLRREAVRMLRSGDVDELTFAQEHHRNTKRQPLAFEDRPYLAGLYRDRAQKTVIKKSVQSNVTERAIVRALVRAQQGFSVLYVVQSQTVRTGFVANRIDRLFDQVGFYRDQQREAVGSADFVGMKHFGAGVIKFVGSNSADEFTEFPADSLIVDELDRCDQTNLLLGPDRLKESALKEDFRFSTPTIEGFGIDALYAESDQRVWRIRCGACGKSQVLDWFRSVVREESPGQYVPRDREWTPEGPRDLSPVCRYCEKPINRLAQGIWVPKYTARPVTGYHISRLLAPPAKEGERIVEGLWADFQRAQSNASAMQVFMNSDLGLAYTAAGAKLTEALLAACIDPALHLVQSAEGCTMGVDVGKIFHVRISRPVDGRRVAQWIGTVADIAELDRLMGAYKVKICVVDSQPETHLVKQFQSRHPGRVFLCRYERERLADPRIDHDAGIVGYDRTQSLDASHADVLDKRNVLPADALTLDGGEYVAQMCAPTRVLDDRTGRYLWLEGSLADHHRHADNYDWIANDLTTRGAVGGGWGAMLI